MKIMYIPDCQVKPGICTDHLEWVGRYAADKRPDVIIQGGDFADMSSLSEYDKGKKAYEGRRYIRDVEAAKRGMDRLVGPIRKAGRYKPRMLLTYGNHEQRISRAIESDPKLAGTLKLSDLSYESYGWKTYPFLEVVKVAGVHFSHYFPTGVMGRPATTPRKILSTYHVSAVAGHQQGRDIAYAYRADGRRLCAIIAGSCYLHNEDYLPPIANQCWRGIVMLHEVRDGQFDEMFVSLNFLKYRYKYGKKGSVK